MPTWQAATKLSIKDKKEFWGARRRAVGGRTEGDTGSGSEESEPDEADEEELPDVGGGRGVKGLPENSLQPVAYHALPRIVTDSLHHAMWGLSTIDLTPCVGELACDNVVSNIGYLGICHTEFQKILIMQQLESHMLKSMKDPQSKVYAPAYAKECEDFEKAKKKDDNAGAKPKKDDEPAPKKPKTGDSATGEATGGSGSGGMSSALAQMLVAAKAAKE